MTTSWLRTWTMALCATTVTLASASLASASQLPRDGGYVAVHCGKSDCTCGKKGGEGDKAPEAGAKTDGKKPEHKHDHDHDNKPEAAKDNAKPAK